MLQKLSCNGVVIFRPQYYFTYLMKIRFNIEFVAMCMNFWNSIDLVGPINLSFHESMNPLQILMILVPSCQNQ